MIRDAILVDALSWFALVLPLFLRQLRVSYEGLGREWVISQARACRGKTGDKVLAMFGKTKGKTTGNPSFMGDNYIDRVTFVLRIGNLSKHDGDG